uniref:EamA domain-containing protein n=1 Tax=Brassica campestris TaxID=3711 RepID=M4E9Z2_BRACM
MTEKEQSSGRVNPMAPLSSLVGSIVEKGFPENKPPPPKPSRLPFPVARHRSHGPHVGSRPQPKVPIVKEEEDDDEEGLINAENYARLQTMSHEEIVKAQAELYEKMDPALVTILKKRGQDKLKKRKHSVPEVSEECPSDIHSPQGGQEAVTPSPSSQVTAIPKEASVASQGFFWDSWTERVEAVRDLRFSFDGCVLENVVVPPPETGVNMSAVERDFLRTEGDPGAAGYTIKEAIALTRSVIPGQRCLALNLLASLLNKALSKLCQSGIGQQKVQSTDWEAIWAYALGPEPGLVLALRMALDDNHASVVLACAKVIQCLLSCSLNENFFDLLENMGPCGKDMFTAPVFRGKPEIDLGLLPGCYWKYSAKPSNIVPFREEIMDDGTEDTDTIQKDVFVAGQDVAAGLVRMDILPRIYHLLETEPTAPLEECLISATIAIARHSPKCTTAILKYPRFVQTIVKRFKLNKRMDVLPSQIFSVRLLKVLARYDKRTCMEFVKNGTFNEVTWHLFQFTSSLDSWVKLGKHKCKLSSDLMVEQLRFLKVCIQSGCCISQYPELFPALCLWLSCPSFEKLKEKNLIREFASVSREAYLVLEAFAGTLPSLYSPRNESDAWDWRYVSPMIDTALSWITLAPELLEWERGTESVSMSTASLLWLYSAVIRTVSKVLDKISAHGEEEPLPWLPEFVPKIGLTIIKHKLLSFSVEKDPSKCSSFMEFLCLLRENCQDEELALASVSCLHGLTRTVVSIQTLIESARSKMETPQGSESIRDGSLLAKGILTESLGDVTSVWSSFRDYVASEWPIMQSIEIHKRGGLAPGVGLGWGASGGGFWSTRVLLTQADAGLLSLFLHISQLDSQGSVLLMDKMNSALAMCLIAGPRDHLLVEKAFDYVLGPHALEHLAGCINSNKRTITSEWKCSEGDYDRMSNVLTSHFKRRWFHPKRKSEAENGSKKVAVGLETIHEEGEMPTEDQKSDSLIVEWAHQRLPLPPQWFLSSISAVHVGKTSAEDQEPTELLEVAKAGVFFIAGLESASGLGTVPTPVSSVPLVWKFHALSTVLLAGMDIIEDKNTRNLYSYLQELYGHVLDERRQSSGRETELLRFKSDVFESYSTFLEMLVEQYAAVSYGDVLYGRQMSIYLHQCVEPSVRLSAWTALSNARVLELLPSLDKCLGDAQGYLEPAEENEGVLEAYLKSWTCGALDRAATRGSVAFTLVLHQFSSLLFCNGDNKDNKEEEGSLRSKIVRTLVRDLSRKQHRQGMMVDLLGYNSKGCADAMEVEEEEESQKREGERRMEVLKEACQGNSSLLSELEKLKECVRVKSQEDYLQPNLLSANYIFLELWPFPDSPFREERVAWRYINRDVVPFAVMVAVECVTVGSTTLFKAASLRGLSFYVFVFYTYVVAALVLLPLSFIFGRSRRLPSAKAPFFFKIFLLALVGFVSMLSGCKGVEYSNPTLASAISTLTPAFTFTLAVIFRMERIVLKSSASQAKVIGTIVSISGALVIVLYKGPKLLSSASLTSSEATVSLYQDLTSFDSSWIIGGVLLVTQYLLVSLWYILQTQVMEVYPEKTTVVLLYILCATIISAPVCMLAEKGLSSFLLKPGVPLASVMYTGGLVSSVGTVIHTWGLHMKGPVYISLFKPLSIVIAVVMAAIFLGDALHLGSVIGSVVLSCGFYTVIWGKAREDSTRNVADTEKSPLLVTHTVEDEASSLRCD